MCHDGVKHYSVTCLNRAHNGFLDWHGEHPSHPKPPCQCSARQWGHIPGGTHEYPLKRKVASDRAGDFTHLKPYRTNHMMCGYKAKSHITRIHPNDQNITLTLTEGC